MVGIDLVFDVYRDHSTKNAERRRGSETLLFQNLNPTQPSKQNKKELVKFVVNY